MDMVVDFTTDYLESSGDYDKNKFNISEYEQLTVFMKMFATNEPSLNPD